MIAGWVAVFTELLTAIAPLECQKAPQGRPWRWLNIGGQRIADRRKHGFGKANRRSQFNQQSINSIILPLLVNRLNRLMNSTFFEAQYSLFRSQSA